MFMLCRGNLTINRNIFLIIDFIIILFFNKLFLLFLCIFNKTIAFFTNINKPNMTQKHFVTIDKYIVFMNERLGKGMFGEVFKGSYIDSSNKKDGEQYLAVKLIELSFFDKEMPAQIVEELENVKQEIRTLRSLKYPNIVRLHDVKRLQSRIYIFMEFCNQGDLRTFIMKNELSEDETLYYFSQIINGFRHIHKKKIVHRDIKPENILMNNYVIKIADFGFAKKVNGETTTSFKGTPLTMSPQILEGDSYSDKTDIYSLGATLYFMFFKTFPFSAPNMIQLVKKLKEKIDPNFEKDGVVISESTKQLILSMLKYEESERIEWDDLFRHPKLQTKKEGQLDLNILGGIDGSMDLEDEEEYEEDLDFDFVPKDNKVDQEKLAKEGEKLIKDWNVKQKIDQINLKFNRKITFDKGIAWFVRRVSKRFSDFKNKLNSFNLEEIPFELLNILKFSLTKYELILMQDINANLRKNNYGFDNKDWEIFLNKDDFKNVEKILKYDLTALIFQISENYNELIEPLKAGYLKTTMFEMVNFLDSNIFNASGQNIDLEEFINFFGNLIIEFLGYFKAKIEKIKINDLATYSRDEYKEILFLIDDFLILLGQENIFVWDEDKPINFNKFFQDRLQFFIDNQMFDFIKERVMIAFEHVIIS